MIIEIKKLKWFKEISEKIDLRIQLIYKKKQRKIKLNELKSIRWHEFYVWYPLVLTKEKGDKNFIWLEKIERRKIGNLNIFIKKYEYRRVVREIECEHEFDIFEDNCEKCIICNKYKTNF